MKKHIKISESTKKHIKNLLMVLFGIILIFFLVFFAAKVTLPDLLGNLNTNNENPVHVVGGELLNKKAPEFDLVDYTGKHIKLSSFIDIPIVLIFWSTWNKESADQIKILDDYLLNQKIQGSLVKIITINSLEDPSIVKSFIKRGGYNIYAGLDVAGEVSNDYSIRGLPTSYFIDKDGFVREIYTGILSESMFVDKVDNLLK